MNLDGRSSVQGRARAPGKLMLLGEYAALEGGWALALAMDTWLTATVDILPGEGVRIEAPAVRREAWQGSWNELSPGAHPEVLRFAAAALLQGWEQPPPGGTLVRLSIHSSFEPRYGLGSSSAVVGAVLVACARAEGRTAKAAELRALGLGIIQEVQGLGSGYDLATQLAGGAVAFQRERSEDLVGTVRNVDGETLPPIRAAWMGRGASTPELVRKVRKSFPRGHTIYAEMSALAAEGIEALQRQDTTTLARLFGEARDWHRRLGTCPDDLHLLLDELEALPGIAAAKLTGAGGGDSAALLLRDGVSLEETERGIRALGLELLNAVPTPSGLLTPLPEATK